MMNLIVETPLHAVRQAESRSKETNDEQWTVFASEQRRGREHPVHTFHYFSIE
jgi:hypothetical protein